MEKPRFLPQEATKEQRRDIIERAAASSEAQGAIVDATGWAYYNRYIEGEMTLPQVMELMRQDDMATMRQSSLSLTEFNSSVLA